MKTKPLTVSEIEYVAHDTAQKFMEWNEPIPEFGSRFPNILESCLKQPFSTFAKKNFFAKEVAASKPKEKGRVIDEIQRFIKAHMVPFE